MIMKWFMAGVFFVVASLSHATVTVSPYFPSKANLADRVEAGRFKILRIGNFNKGDRLLARVEVSDPLFPDVSAYILDEFDFALIKQGKEFKRQGYTKKVAPFEIKYEAPSAGPLYLMLDNSYAALVGKNVRVQLFQMGKDQDFASTVQSMLEKTYSDLEKLFVFPPFDIVVEPCGQENAFSAFKDGKVTMCSELFTSEMSKQKPGAIVAILFHEFGHTLLNLWGERNFDNEDVVDEFATVFLLRSGPLGKKALDDWVSFWLDQDSTSEAQRLLVVGGKHNLSIQRARNIRNWMSNPVETAKRWNPEFYRHMAIPMLKKAISSPSIYDDVAKAKAALDVRLAQSEAISTR